MRIKLRFFASLRERLGKSEEMCEVPRGATVATVWALLVQEHPELAAVEHAVAFAVAHEYVDKDHPLQDNDELAFIPPVSGGAMTEEQPRVFCHITDSPIDVQKLLEFVADPAAGATATFLGTTRNTNDGRRVIRLEYECYPGMAEKEMRKIAAAALSRWPIVKIAMVHRIGRVDIGEASVAIAVSSGHRHAAFEACHYAIDRLKDTVPIWKKELYEGGELWIGSQTGTGSSCQRWQEEDTRETHS
jgi:molybdopterin synthase catalytic subunit